MSCQSNSMSYSQVSDLASDFLTLFDSDFVREVQMSCYSVSVRNSQMP